MTELATVKNENRCDSMEETHILNVSRFCPISLNPLPGSEIEICYEPGELILEVASLRNYVDSYSGGRGEIRSMEGMCQAIAQDCAQILNEPVTLKARLKINPAQEMRLECYAFPK